MRKTKSHNHEGSSPFESLFLQNCPQLASEFVKASRANCQEETNRITDADELDRHDTRLNLDMWLNVPPFLMPML
jgi:hypothetical protein